MLYNISLDFSSLNASEHGSVTLSRCHQMHVRGYVLMKRYCEKNTIIEFLDDI